MYVRASTVLNHCEPVVAALGAVADTATEPNTTLVSPCIVKAPEEVLTVIIGLPSTVT